MLNAVRTAAWDTWRDHLENRELPMPQSSCFCFSLTRRGASVVLPLCVTLLAAGSWPGRAEQDGPLVPIQEELRKQQYYSGEITGELDEATAGALKRYQIRNGLKVTGDVDAETLQSLAGTQQPAASPAVDALVGDRGAGDDAPARERARELVVSDRDFLGQVEKPNPGPPPPLADSQPVGATPPPEVPREMARPRERSSEALERVPAGTKPAPIAERTSPPEREVATESIHRSSNPEAITNVERGRGARGIAADASETIEAYLAAAQGPTPDRELSFYGDRVRYFDSGIVSRNFIEKDQGRYYRRWPDRKFSLVGEPEVVRTDGGSATVRFRIRYSLHRGNESASGGTENLVQLENGPQGYKIVSIRERKISP